MVSKSVVTEQIGQPKTKAINRIAKVTLNGEERTIIVSAVQERTKNIDTITTFKLDQFKDGETRTETTKRVEYTLTRVGFGLSVLNPDDAYNEQLGVSIAQGRALSPKASLGVLFATDGSLSLPVVDLLVTEKVSHIQKYVGKYIKLVSKEEKEAKLLKQEATSNKLTSVVAAYAAKPTTEV